MLSEPDMEALLVNDWLADLVAALALFFIPQKKRTGRHTLSNKDFEDKKTTLQHQSERKRKSRSAPALALEVFSIVLGVLLALALSEWADDRENHRLAKSALLNISQEISSNLETLTLIHENNVQTVNAITAQSEPDADESLSIIPGIQLQETAWESFLATGMSAYVNYDTILSLSKMYAIQRVYKQTGMQLSESAMNATAYATALGTTVDDRHFQEQFIGYFQLLTQIEAQLLSSYRDGLDTFDL